MRYKVHLRIMCDSFGYSRTSCRVAGLLDRSKCSTQASYLITVPTETLVQLYVVIRIVLTFAHPHPPYFCGSRTHPRNANASLRRDGANPKTCKDEMK